MNKPQLLLVISLFFLCHSFAQNPAVPSTNKEKNKAVKSISNPAFKSVPGGRVLQAAPRNQNKVQVAKMPTQNTTAPAAIQSFAGTGVAAKQNEPVLYNYNKLSALVRQRLDANKSSGRDQLDGIGKQYDIIIPAIQSASDINSKLTALTSLTGLIRKEFISPGKIRLLVKPQVTSEKLKEVLSTSSVTFDFQKEEFILIQ